MVFDAPGRFSTTNDCLNASENLSASIRAMMSVPPPALAPTRTFTGRVGQAGSAAVAGAARSAAQAAASRVVQILRIDGLLRRVGARWSDAS